MNPQRAAARLAGGPRRGGRAGAGANDPDTVFVGHVAAGAPFDHGPYHLGRGPRRLTQGGSPANAPAAPRDWDGTWGWDLYQPDERDSLMGWWPLKLPQRLYSGSGNLADDKQRSWQALDHGNQLNYRSNALTGGVPRTFGVAGLWHRDPGAGGTVGAKHMTWNPIQGTHSAWCGLREHGDLTVWDDTPGVGNPFNAQITQFSFAAGGPAGTSTHFPGYPEQVDQMLFRDITPSPGQPLAVAYDFVSRMSTGVSADPALLHGWFDKDPLKPPTLQDGNFISATDANPVTGAPAPPVDSFMVYLGVPVDDAACRFSDGRVGPVYDPLRRWFSEVLAVDKPYVELASVAGAQGGHDPTTGALTPVRHVHAVPAAVVDQLRAAGNGSLRLVFRVKTNHGSDDSDFPSYSSDGVGAVVLDNVAIAGGASLAVGFESPADIDNAASPAAAFHSTGKPPAARWHVHDLATLDYQDLCGPPDSPSRRCNIFGHVLSGGDHDDGEAAGGAAGTAEQEQLQLVASPTLNLVNGGVGAYNGLGIDEEIASRPEVDSFYDVYAGRFSPSVTGNVWSYGFQSYPVRQANGAKTWGPILLPPVVYYNPEPACFSSLEYNASEGLMVWDPTASASPAHPDSIRIFWSYAQACFAFGVTAGCSPRGGMYLDNVAVAFVRSPASVVQAARGGEGTPAVGSLSASLWNWFQDAFPANDAPGLPGTLAFDTTAAHVKTGRNLAPAQSGSGPLGALARPVVPGDSAIVSAPGSGMRLDLIFSIKPGPGNYRDATNRALGLKRRPDAPDIAVAGDASFWGQYMANPGERASPGAAAQHAAAPGGWDWDVWNSAREDTAERNYFPVGARGNLPGIAPGVWATTYHDDDPRGGAHGNGGSPGPLALPRNRCFLVDPVAPAPVSSANTTCGASPYPPAWATVPGTGFDGNPITYEYTKIFPDGLFTPGTHVRYFHRKEEIATGAFALLPDTTMVSPQVGEGSTDGHRWQQFGVLPDRWKSPFYGGAGGLCMLFVDGADSRGNERVWVGVMDSICGAASDRWGAHNGWHAVGGADVNDPANNRLPDGSPGFRADHGGQPGTLYDMFGVKAAESLTTSVGAFGSRLAAPGYGYLAGQDARIGPTPEMLEAYYRTIVWLAGDVHTGVLGPIPGRTSDDVALIAGFLDAATASSPRAAWLMGDGIAEGESAAGGAHAELLQGRFGAGYRGGYVALSGNDDACTPLVPTAPVSTVDLYGVAAGVCQWSNDVLVPSADPAVAAAPYLYYAPIGAGAPYAAGVRTSETAAKHFRTALDGFDIANLSGAYCMEGLGRLLYVRNVMESLIAPGCLLPGGCPLPIGVGDDPRGPQGRDVLRLLSANPVRGGAARIGFEVARPGEWELGIFDLAGRRVRLLTRQVFPAGRFERVWDGLDDERRRVPPGVYFYRLRSGPFATARRAVVLK